jgi:hypothetical protein
MKECISEIAARLAERYGVVPHAARLLAALADHSNGGRRT